MGYCCRQGGRLMKLHEFVEMVEREREAQRLTNLEKIATIIATKEKENK